VPYKKAKTTETTVLLRSWKKTPTAIRVSVSKIYVTFCGAAAKLRARMTVEVPRSHTVRYRHNRLESSERVTSPLSIQHTTNTNDEIQCT